MERFRSINQRVVTNSNQSNADWYFDFSAKGKKQPKSDDWEGVLRVQQHNTDCHSLSNLTAKPLSIFPPPTFVCFFVSNLFYLALSLSLSFLLPTVFGIRQRKGELVEREFARAWYLRSTRHRRRSRRARYNQNKMYSNHFSFET